MQVKIVLIIIGVILLLGFLLGAGVLGAYLQNRFGFFSYGGDGGIQMPPLFPAEYTVFHVRVIYTVIEPNRKPKKIR